MTALIIAALAGVTMALQGSLNSVLGKVSGLWEATFVVHLVGLLFVSALIFLIFPLGLADCNLAAVFKAPWYAFLGGVLGVLIIYGVVKSIPRVGVAPATTAIITGQVLTAAVVDHFGLFGLQKIPFNAWRVVGVLLLAAGAWVLLRR